MDTQARNLGPRALVLAAIVAATAPCAWADGPPAASKAPAAAPPATAPHAKQPLDLSAPPVEHVMPRSQVQTLVTDNSAQGEDVRVEQTRYHEQPPVGFFQALPWGLTHPMQAWRLFTPVVTP